MTGSVACLPLMTRTFFKQLLDVARRPATDVAAMMKDLDPKTRRKARSVLNYMDEAALGPLLDPKFALAPEDELGAS